MTIDEAIEYCRSKGIHYDTEHYLQISEWLEEMKVLREKAKGDKWYQQGRADAIEEFDRICEEARGHKFGVCDADFVIDVIKAKVKEQLKEQKNE